MPAHAYRCDITDDGTPPPSAPVLPLFDASAGVDDGGPKPHRRGGYRGFLPSGVVNDLNTSASSGAGAALLTGSAHRGPSPVGKLLLIGLLVWAVS